MRTRAWLPAAPATVAGVLRPPLTTVEQDGHLAAAAYLMKHACATVVEGGSLIGMVDIADVCRALLNPPTS